MYWQDAQTIAFSNKNKAQNIACRESQEIRDVIASASDPTTKQKLISGSVLGIIQNLNSSHGQNTNTMSLCIRSPSKCEACSFKSQQCFSRRKELGMLCWESGHVVNWLFQCNAMWGSLCYHSLHSGHHRPLQTLFTTYYLPQHIFSVSMSQIVQTSC